MQGVHCLLLEPEQFLPAARQGILAYQCHEGNNRIRQLAARLDHFPTYLEYLAETALLTELGGDCNSAFAALARLGDGTLSLSAEIYTPTGSERSVAQSSVVIEKGKEIEACQQARTLGRTVAGLIHADIAERFAQRGEQMFKITLPQDKQKAAQA